MFMRADSGRRTAVVSVAIVMLVGMTMVPGGTSEEELQPFAVGWVKFNGVLTMEWYMSGWGGSAGPHPELGDMIAEKNFDSGSYYWSFTGYSLDEGKGECSGTEVHNPSGELEFMENYVDCNWYASVELFKQPGWRTGDPCYAEVAGGGHLYSPSSGPWIQAEAEGWGTCDEL